MNVPDTVTYAVAGGGTVMVPELVTVFVYEEYSAVSPAVCVTVAVSILTLSV